MGLTLKTVIRCADYRASRRFYHEVLGLEVLTEWDLPQGSGCTLGFGEAGFGGILELYQMTPADSRYDPAFGKPFPSDKVDLQLGTSDLAAWQARLDGVWPYEGPVTMPWPESRLKLRDPDGLLVQLCVEGAEE